MKIDHMRVVDISPDDLARCRELSFGDEGYMCEDLDHILAAEQGHLYRYSQALLLRDPNILGWCLLQPIHKRPRYSAQFFVDPDHRGKGYGRMLLMEANRWSKAPLCYIDDENAGFFEKFPLMHEPYKEDTVV